MWCSAVHILKLLKMRVLKSDIGRDINDGGSILRLMAAAYIPGGGKWVGMG